MNEYKVRFSYMRDGRRVYETDFTYTRNAVVAAYEIRREYSNLDGLRIEQVWIDTGRAWEVREFDY